LQIFGKVDIKEEGNLEKIIKMTSKKINEFLEIQYLILL